MVNMRDFIREVTEEEGGDVNLSIAQVGEVVKLAMIKLAKLPKKELLQTVKRYEEK